MTSVTSLNNMQLYQKLSKALGLSNYESKVYIALENNGPLHVKNIAKYASLPRTAVYPPLISLMQKGLVSENIFGKRKYYSAVPTNTLKDLFEEKRLSIESAISELNATRQITSESAKLETTFYAGEQGIKSAGLIFLNETREKIWYSFENLGKVSESVGLDFEAFYIKERIKRGIQSKMILSITEESAVLAKFLKNDLAQLRKTVQISPNEYPFETTVCATKGLLLLINPNDNKFALLIRNKHLANTIIQIHRCVWDRYQN